MLSTRHVHISVDNLLVICRRMRFNADSIAKHSGETYAKHRLRPECTESAAMSFVATFDDVTDVAKEGEQLYAARYQTDCERDHPGHFIALDINSGEAFVAEFAENAIHSALEANPDCVVHLVKIGSPSAFTMGYLFAC